MMGSLKYRRFRVCVPSQFRSTSTALMASTTAEPTLAIYGHPISQPTRAVLWLLAVKQLRFRFVRVDPSKGECATDEYLRKFPAGTIPALEDTSVMVDMDSSSRPLRMTEGHAILSYLCHANGWQDWYPYHSPARKANVDMWLHWHHQNTRLASIRLFGPLMFVGQAPPKGDAHVAKTLKPVFLTMIHGGVKGGTATQPKFLGGGSAPTIADIGLYCELDQLVYLDLFDFAPYPDVVVWMNHMRKLPYHDNVRGTLVKMAAAQRAKRKDMPNAPSKL